MDDTQSKNAQSTVDKLTDTLVVEVHRLLSELHKATGRDHRLTANVSKLSNLSRDVDVSIWLDGSRFLLYDSEETDL